MLLPDVNVLVYAHRSDSADHSSYKQWIAAVLGSDAAFGVSDVVLSGFVRIVTHPGIFKIPTGLDVALSFVDQIRGRPNAVPIVAGARHWDIFKRLCLQADARGNLVADAYLAAIAIESGCEWVTTDRDYSRFEGLRWRHPLDDRSAR